MNMPDMGAMMKVIGAWNKFKENHPKFPAFISAVRRKGIKEDTIIAISIIDPDGEKIETNLKVMASDLELINSLVNGQM